MKKGKDSIAKPGFILMIICLSAALALAYTYHLTKPEIEKQGREEELRALEVVLPGAVHFSGREKGREIDFYRGLGKRGELVGYAFSGKARGYSSEIKVMVGVGPEGTVTAIKITGQKETPGLGDKIDRPPVRRTLWQALLGEGEGQVESRPRFQTQFAAKSLADLEMVTGPTERNIQAITGATISSKAVTGAVRESLASFLRQLDETEAVIR